MFDGESFAFMDVIIYMYIFCWVETYQIYPFVVLMKASLKFVSAFNFFVSMFTHFRSEKNHYLYKN